jgi:transcription elongation GreA/GreB family factor
MNKPEKQRIVEMVRQRIADKLEALTAQGKLLQQSVANESKSSAGDKHETSRAMINLEQEKLGQQVQELLRMQERFEKTDFNSPSSVVKMGSLITTNNGKFLLSIGLGKVAIQNEKVLLLSSQSPLGEALLGKTAGDKIQLNSHQFIIEEVI